MGGGGECRWEKAMCICVPILSASCRALWKKEEGKWAPRVCIILKFRSPGWLDVGSSGEPNGKVTACWKKEGQSSWGDFFFLLVLFGGVWKGASMKHRIKNHEVKADTAGKGRENDEKEKNQELFYSIK